jgi:hypothetical protein
VTAFDGGPLVVKCHAKPLHSIWGTARWALPSSRRAPLTFLNDSLAGRPGLAALGAHSALSFCANAETNTPDYDTDTRRRAFLDDPASFRARFLNDVEVGKSGRNDQNRKSGTGQNCSHGTSPLG